MNYETSNNEPETLSADERRIGELCRTLKAVEAPNDFDFKLKARIANSKASDFAPRRRFIPAMRFALPALALILVLGVLAYTGGFLSGGNNASTIAAVPVAPQIAAPPENRAVSGFAPTSQTSNENAAVVASTPDSPKSSDVAVTTVRQPKKAAAETIRRPRENENGGSTDQALTNFQPLTPRNNMPQIVPQSSPVNEAANPIPVREVLQQNGINADFENGKWTVRSVTPNSLGDSSGVRQNDVIEEIDNQPVSGTTVFNKIVNGKTITVTRNGQKSVIKLRIRQ